MWLQPLVKLCNYPQLWYETIITPYWVVLFVHFFVSFSVPTFSWEVISRSSPNTNTNTHMHKHTHSQTHIHTTLFLKKGIKIIPKKRSQPKGLPQKHRSTEAQASWQPVFLTLSRLHLQKHLEPQDNTAAIQKYRNSPRGITGKRIIKYCFGLSEVLNLHKALIKSLLC